MMQSQGSAAFLPMLVRSAKLPFERVDLVPQELVVGGDAADTEQGAELKALGVTVLQGVRAAANLVKDRIAALKLRRPGA